MIDEFNNDAPFDFKNILIISSFLSGNAAEIWNSVFRKEDGSVYSAGDLPMYLFSAITSTDEKTELTDATVGKNSIIRHGVGSKAADDDYYTSDIGVRNDKANQQSGNTVLRVYNNKINISRLIERGSYVNFSTYVIPEVSFIIASANSIIKNNIIGESNTCLVFFDTSVGPGIIDIITSFNIQNITFLNTNNLTIGSESYDLSGTNNSVITFNHDSKEIDINNSQELVLKHNCEKLTISGVTNKVIPHYTVGKTIDNSTEL